MPEEFTRRLVNLIRLFHFLGVLQKNLDLIMVCSIFVMRIDSDVTFAMQAFFQCYQRFQPDARESRRLASGVNVKKGFRHFFTAHTRF